MNWIFSAFVALALAASFAGAKETFKGDVNYDAMLNDPDWMLTVGYLRGSESLADGQLWAADWDCSGSVSYADAYGIYCAIHGPTSFKTWLQIAESINVQIAHECGILSATRTHRRR